MTLDRPAATERDVPVASIASRSRLRRPGGWVAPASLLVVYTGVIQQFLSSSTGRVYGFPISHDMRTVIEVALQIAPMLAACFLVPLLPAKQRLIERLARGAQPIHRVATIVVVSAAIAVVVVLATAIAVIGAAQRQLGAISAITVLTVAGELVFDLALIGVFTTMLHALTRRLWITILLFLAYIFAVVNAGPYWGITAYIGFGSSFPVTLTTYSTAPLYEHAAWLFRAYWTSITLLILAVLHALDRPDRALLTAIANVIRGRTPGSRSDWYPVLAMGAVCVAVGTLLVKMQDSGEARYRSVPQAALDRLLDGDNRTARLQLLHYDVVLDYRPDEAEVAIESKLTFRNGDQPSRTVYFQMPGLLTPDRFEIPGSGDYRLVQSGRYVQVTFLESIPPLGQTTVEYRGSIRSAGAFDLAVQQKVLSSAFFLTDGDVLLAARSAACLASLRTRCGDAENYLMSDVATGRISVIAPRPYRVSSPGSEATIPQAGGRLQRVFTVGSPRLATFLVACAQFRETVTVGRTGVRIRVLRSSAAAADGELEAPLVDRILTFYETAWRPYPRRDLTIVETPTPLGEAMAYEGTVAISDKIISSRSPVFGSASHLLEFVMAHEIAHQWWGFSVVPTRTPGRQFLIESIPQFAAYKMLGHQGILSENTARENEDRRYRERRRPAGALEVPLVRAEAADELAYFKGAFALLSLDQKSDGALMHRLGELATTYSHDTHGRTSPEEFMSSLVAALPQSGRQQAHALLYEPGDQTMAQ